MQTPLSLKQIRFVLHGCTNMFVKLFVRKWACIWYYLQYKYAEGRNRAYCLLGALAGRTHRSGEATHDTPRKSTSRAWLSPCTQRAAHSVCPSQTTACPSRTAGTQACHHSYHFSCHWHGVQCWASAESARALRSSSLHSSPWRRTPCTPPLWIQLRCCWPAVVPCKMMQIVTKDTVKKPFTTVHLQTVRWSCVHFIGMNTQKKVWSTQTYYVWCRDSHNVLHLLVKCTIILTDSTVWCIFYGCSWREI